MATPWRPNPHSCWALTFALCACGRIGYDVVTLTGGGGGEAGRHDAEGGAGGVSRPGAAGLDAGNASSAAGGSSPFDGSTATAGRAGDGTDSGETLLSAGAAGAAGHDATAAGAGSASPTGDGGRAGADSASSGGTLLSAGAAGHDAAPAGAGGAGPTGRAGADSADSGGTTFSAGAAGAAGHDATAVEPAGAGGVGGSSAVPWGGLGGSSCTPSAETCDGLDNDCNGAVDDTPTMTTLCASDSVCVDGSCQSLPPELACDGLHLTTHAYAWCSVAADWAAASVHCESLGAHLATITSVAEDQALKSLLTKQDDAWIGLTRAVSCEWRWVTGEPVSYTAWPVNYPDGACGPYDCAQLWGRREGQWDDTYCTDEQSFLCEWESAP